VQTFCSNTVVIYASSNSKAKGYKKEAVVSLEEGKLQYLALQAHYL
jgi:hypothetical protein